MRILKQIPLGLISRSCFGRNWACYIRKVFPTGASIYAAGCICSVRVFACKNVWRRGRWVLWLAGVVPAPVDRWAELLASSPICPPITEQSARPDNTICRCISWIPLSSPPLSPTAPLPSLPPLLLLLLLLLSSRLIGLPLSPCSPSLPSSSTSFSPASTQTRRPQLHPSSI